MKSDVSIYSGSYRFSGMSLWKKLSLLLAIYFLSGCNLDISNNNAPILSEELEFLPDTGRWSGDSAWVFNQEALRSYELTLPESEWQGLKDNAVLETYVPAFLSIDGEQFGTVGLRFKGSFGSLFSCVDAQGVWSCDKAPMKIKFNEYNPDLRFYGLKRLNFHAKKGDFSKMNERLGFWLFQQMGVEAPRTVHARLVVNGEYQGLFSLVEEVDGRFAENRFPIEPNGNLYKEVWPSFSDPDIYLRGLETNNERGDVAGMLAFAAALEKATLSNFSLILEGWMDRDKLLSYLVVDDAIQNWDGLKSFYCWSGECKPHNFFWYHEPQFNRFSLIPWDIDFSFDPTNRYVRNPDWLTPIEKDDCGRRYPLLSAEVAHPGCQPILGLLAKVASMEYRERMRDFVNGPFNLTNLYTLIDSWQKQIDLSIQEEGDETSYIEWNYEVERLKSHLVILNEKSGFIASGELVYPFRIKLNSITDFEQENFYSIANSIDLEYNYGSVLSLAINSETPLLGENDLRINFTINNPNPLLAWGQRVQVVLPVELGVSTDLRSYQGVRLMISSDTSRTVYIELNSLGYSQSGVPELRWQVEANLVGKEVTLLFSEAKLPSWADASQTEDLNSVLQQLSSLSIKPRVVGLQSDGLFADGTNDSGYIQIDSIEFYK